MTGLAIAREMTPPPPDTLDSWVEDGVKFHRDGNLSAAKAVYEAVLAVNPDHLQVLSLMGLTLHQSGNSAAGEALIRRAVEQAPDAAILRDHLGLALDGMGQVEAAMEAHAESVILDPAHAPGWYNLGMLLLRGSRSDDALRCVMHALDVDPRNPVYRAGFGRILTGLGHYPEAADAYRLALLADPSFVEAYSGLAALWEATGNNEAANYATDAVQKLRAGNSESASLIARTISQHIDATFPTTIGH